MEEQGTLDKVELTLDCRGLLCPTPVLRLSGAVKTMKVGGIVEVVTSDPGAKQDIPEWSLRNKNELLRMEEEAGVLKFYIRKTA